MVKRYPNFSSFPNPLQVPEASTLQYLERAAIDPLAWDACIEQSPEGLIYAQSFYLDAMADNWAAVVLNDYEAVMPLPWRKKWGIRYVYQLPFVQRLGIYGNSLTNETIAAFYKEAVRHFPFINYKTGQALTSSAAVLRTCSNFVIDLSRPYPEIRNGFSQECLKNIRKAENRGCRLGKVPEAKQVVDFFKAAYGHYYNSYTDGTYRKLELLIEKGCAAGKCKTHAITNPEGETVFTAALFQDDRRIYYCTGAPNEEGREMRATYFFIHEILRQHAAQKLLFDFEGSDLPNVAAFYSKFGPATETYFEVIINRLPRPFRWLKEG